MVAREQRMDTNYNGYNVNEKKKTIIKESESYRKVFKYEYAVWGYFWTVKSLVSLIDFILLGMWCSTLPMLPFNPYE